MEQDDRSCDTGACIINAEGLCWCGQAWGAPAAQPSASTAPQPADTDTDTDTDTGTDTQQGDTP